MSYGADASIIDRDLQGLSKVYVIYFFTFLVRYNSRYIFFYYKMAVVLKGEQQNDGSFVFAASSEQVNSLNKMCDGNLNTQLSDVQFGMKMKAESLDLSNITAEFSFPYIERVRGFNLNTMTITLNQMSNMDYRIKNKSYKSLIELFDDVCA